MALVQEIWKIIMSDHTVDTDPKAAQHNAGVLFPIMTHGSMLNRWTEHRERSGEFSTRG